MLLQYFNIIIIIFINYAIMLIVIKCKSTVTISVHKKKIKGKKRVGWWDTSSIRWAKTIQKF